MYRTSLQANYDGDIRDFWDGKLFQKLQAAGMFLDYRDLAFFCSTDGVNLFRKGIYMY